MACGKGTIIFNRVQEITKIYARINIHREPIKVIEEVPGHIISIC